MTSLAYVLAWKFNNAPGIMTGEQPDGSMAITQWPESLGPVPTQEQIAQWTAEYTPPRIITYTAFEDRFTDTEADAIAALSLQNATIHRVVTRAAASNSIDLDSPKLAEFMAALVQAGIITEARGAEILGE